MTRVKLMGRHPIGTRELSTALWPWLVAILLIAGGLVVWPSDGSAQARPPDVSRTSELHRLLPTAVAGIGASLVNQVGLQGPQAQWVINENKLPGTTAWRITGPSSGIAGFVNPVSAQVGQSVALYVSTTAPAYHVDAYRMGYYGGAGARLIWESAEVAGSQQPACPVAAVTNMVSCDNWSPSMSLMVSPAFVQGDYLLELVGSEGQASYVPLTVWDPTSTATYVLENDEFTWQAWNDYGGYDFYAGLGRCAGTYPPCNRARVVSFDRPYAYGEGAADFLGQEYPLVRFAEQYGLDVTYAPDVDFDLDPGFLLQHRVIVSMGHDECWSLTERLAAQNAEHHGVNITFFGASAILRHVRMQSSPLGVEREEVDYRDSAADPEDYAGDPLEVTGNTWSSSPTDWSEVPFVGEAYSGYLLPAEPPVPLVVTDASSWIYQGTGLQDGASIPGVLDSDFDQFDPGVHPADLQILAHSPMPSREVESSVRPAYSDMTYYTDPTSGAGVFDTGTVAWVPGLGSNPVLQQMTANLLGLFGQGPAGQLEPSVGNWQRFYPGGGPASGPMAVASAANPDSAGWWTVWSDGAVTPGGDAIDYGGMSLRHLNAPMAGIAATPDGAGYWLLGADGGVFSFGDAGYYGSTGNLHLASPALTMASSKDGHGYYFAAGDGGVFSFGDATFHGSMGGQRLDKPVVGMAVTPDGGGYWLVASDGGVFSFGDATFYGSTGSQNLPSPITAITATPDGHGYWLLAKDGAVYTFGDAAYYGNATANTTNTVYAVGLINDGAGTGYRISLNDGTTVALNSP